ncbi:acetolactate synthase catalytic subunit [Coprinopsis cinerea okayama7|uniref:Acetolactate synthase catalytic subunit n=1 Tax=Coprinopsis cinerea (strain Okayama-7 / 130 / ATCC MYA-4618 / FGSC 9003) TaxID=240176 RepID=A8PEV6_COPC7|nr:acetolactate synthase catalytic subunit [Coprinopsis cinerea okayama7\|eukprot:XP_001840854.1 acetolactate synthase catalytic subunit [Coprinopsis cinerea okayama7\
MFTASSIFLQALCDSGITHAFVNWGSDHPALLADLERQRSTATAGNETKPTIVTCPNEMVALSAAQGYAQVTGKPALVIVHVDVGTQALAGAVHNVDRCRAPVIIYAGASPFSTEGEHKGTRNEWIMWLQDVPDQPSIVRQYMRYTAQLNSALSIPGTIRRSIQIATSEPKGPVYLWARREVMEQEVDPLLVREITATNAAQSWPPVEPTALSSTAASRIATALLTAQHPLIITSHIGRNPHAVSPLLALSTLLAIPILPVCPSVVCVPHSHPFGLASTYLNSSPSSNVPSSLDESPAPESPHASRDLNHLAMADVILVVDSDLTWIPGNDQRPAPGSRIFFLDGGDPLKTTVQMGWWRGEAEMICKADAEVALGQIVDVVREVDQSGLVAEGEDVKRRARWLKRAWQLRVQDMDAVELDFASAGSILPEETPTDGTPEPSFGETLKSPPIYTVPNILRALREGIRELTPSRGERVLVLNETITNFQFIWEHMRPEVPGSLLTSGGSSLGWALGAAVGASLGGSPKQPQAATASGVTDEGITKHDLIVAIVGDGCYMFGVPSSAYWMAMRYQTPFLTIILNNGGWKAPKLSMLSVHPIGHNNEQLSSVSGDTLTTGFGPICPDYSQIAVAASAGWAWGARVGGRTDANGVFNGNPVASILKPSEEDVSPTPQDGGKALLEDTIRKGIEVVVKEKRCAVIDCFLDGI